MDCERWDKINRVEFCRKAHSLRLRSTPRNSFWRGRKGQNIDFECFPAQNPYVLRKNHTPAAPLRQLQSPLAPVACQMQIREIRRGITRRNSFHALDYIARRRRRDLTPSAGDNRVWITFD